MNSVKEIKTSDNNASVSRALQFIGVPIVDAQGKLLEGEVTLSDGTLARFHEGFLDGQGFPALEYEYGGREYWTKGFPHGYPAVIQNFGYTEEDWEHGQILCIRTEVKVELSEN